MNTHDISADEARRILEADRQERFSETKAKELRRAAEYICSSRTHLDALAEAYDRYYVTQFGFFRTGELKAAVAAIQAEYERKVNS